MNFEKACDILELKRGFSIKELRHHYKLKALKFHPDKNKKSDAHEKFIEIGKAYEFLKTYRDEEIEFDSDYSNSTDYISLLSTFLVDLLKKTDINIEANSIKRILKVFTDKSSQISISKFEEFDKPTALKIYGYLIQYKDVFQIDEEILESYKNIVIGKYDNDTIILLEPTLDNLLHDEIYKLDHNNDIYYIPLWHDELTYDISNTNLIVKCTPKIPDNMEIDSNNNLHVNIAVSILSAFKEENVTFQIGVDKFEIPSSRLFIKKNQTYIFGKGGIPLINTTNVYDVSKRGDIIVNLTLIE
jgi:preprotein translocase subunit Sec63